MTAKEQKERARLVISIDLAKMEGKVYYKFTATDFDNFCEQLCKEQREICNQNYQEGNDDSVSDSILNAPTPDL